MFSPTLCMTVVKQRGKGAPFLYGGDLIEGLAVAARLGYSGAELHVRAPQELELERLKPRLKESGLRICALGTGRVYVDDGLSLIDPAMRSDALTRLKGFIDAAQELGAKVIVGCMRGNVPDGGTVEESLRLLGASMREADSYAAQKGVTILIEPINRYENNYLCSIYDAAAFIRENSLVSTKIIADLFHMNIEEHDPIRAIADHVPLISYVHAADSNRMYPGGGHTDFSAALRALRSGGFAGEISAECLPLPDDETAATAWLTNMKGLLETL